MALRIHADRPHTQGTHCGTSTVTRKENGTCLKLVTSLFALLLTLQLLTPRWLSGWVSNDIPRGLEVWSAMRIDHETVGATPRWQTSDIYQELQAASDTVCNMRGAWNVQHWHARSGQTANGSCGVMGGCTHCYVCEGTFGFLRLGAMQPTQVLCMTMTKTMTTLIEDVSSNCWASGPVGMSDGVVTIGRTSEIW